MTAALTDPPLLPHNREAFAANVALTDAIAALYDPDAPQPRGARACAAYCAFAAYLDAFLGVPTTAREIDDRHAALADFAKRIGLTRADLTCAA